MGCFLFLFLCIVVWYGVLEFWLLLLHDTHLEALYLGLDYWFFDVGFRCIITFSGLIGLADNDIRCVVSIA